ncbi:MAG: cytochrome c biogenesis protein CcsA [Deltaproteobacteria bacterium]|nr:cytochrome c biogenesis protein CcsA [Deltaproteobacteria bacterium]
MKLEKWLPAAAGAVAILAVLYAVKAPPKVRGLDLDAFGHLPVLEGGRVKPIDSLARNTLLVIRSQQSFAFQGRTVKADEWLLDTLFRPQVADEQPIFVIDDPEVLALFGLQQSRNRYYSFKELRPRIEELEKQAQAAGRLDAKQRTRFQAAAVNLSERVYLYWRLQNTVQVVGSPGLMAELATAGSPESAERARYLSQMAHFRPLPPLSGQPVEAWKSVGEALSQKEPHPGLTTLARLANAYTFSDAQGFNQAVGELRKLGAAWPDLASKASQELYFNRIQPFLAGIVIYVMALLLVFVSWIWKPQILQPTSFALLSAGALVHTLGLAYRIILQGRPPVTNLYSSAVFVGWGAVVLGVILEWVYRKGFGTAVAAATGIGSLIVAHNLANDGDTMEMMRAVLDSNFWLGTHVITITIGYSGTYLAGAIAIAWALRRHIVKDPDPATSKALYGATYGIICFSVFFSFLGTVLGGIWADQSWGRFWGWDPKENGALLIVLWNAIILHARWGGFARERGIMTMAIFGNVITSLSWFGVNMLGVGLHSYGFMDKAFWALAGFSASQIALMGVALLPPRFWQPGAFAAEQQKAGAGTR